MKKAILGVIVVLFLGVVMGRVMYQKVSDIYALDDDNIIYLLQLGVYNNKKDIDNNTKGIDNKLIIKDKSNYYVYVGISKSKSNLEKISKIYNNLGYNLYLKETTNNNDTFLSNLENFDKMLKLAKTKDEILAINAVILSSYEEIVLKK